MQRPTYIESSFNVGVTHHPIPNPGSNTDATVIYYTVLILMKSFPFTMLLFNGSLMVVH